MTKALRVILTWTPGDDRLPKKKQKRVTDRGTEEVFNVMSKVHDKLDGYVSDSVHSSLQGDVDVAKRDADLAQELAELDKLDANRRTRAEQKAHAAKEHSIHQKFHAANAEASSTPTKASADAKAAAMEPPRVHAFNFGKPKQVAGQGQSSLPFTKMRFGEVFFTTVRSDPVERSQSHVLHEDSNAPTV